MANLRTDKSLLMPCQEYKSDGHENTDLIVSPNCRQHYTQNWSFIVNDDDKKVTYLGNEQNHTGILEIEYPIRGVVKNEWIQTGICNGEGRYPSVRRNLDPYHHFSHLNLFSWDEGMLTVAQNYARTRCPKLKLLLSKTPEFGMVMKRWVEVCEVVGGCPSNLYWDQIGYPGSEEYVELKGRFDGIPVYERPMFFPPMATQLVSKEAMELDDSHKRDYYLSLISMILFTFDLRVDGKEPLKVQCLRRHIDVDYKKMNGTSAKMLYQLTIHSFTVPTKKSLKELSVYGVNQWWEHSGCNSYVDCRSDCSSYSPVFYKGRSFIRMRIKNWQFVHILENIYGPLDYVANSCILFNGWLIPVHKAGIRGRKPLDKSASLINEKEDLCAIAYCLTIHGYAQDGYLEG
nr:S2 [Penaeid oriental virus]